MSAYEPLNYHDYLIIINKHLLGHPNKYERYALTHFLHSCPQISLRAAHKFRSDVLTNFANTAPQSSLRGTPKCHPEGSIHFAQRHSSYL